MNYDERLQNVTVLGAAGKMGSGILLLTAIEMADLSLKPENKGKTFCLNAMDVSPQGLSGLMRYLKDQVQKVAEKKTVLLRKLYEDRADLIENEEIINEYVFDVMNIVRPVTTIESAYNSNLVFEAIIENEDLKTKIFSQIHENKPGVWFFTNTSSIPIHILDEKAKLNGQILGFHFYNPPAVQRLVELITINTNSDEMVEFAKTYAKNLRKVVVTSNDKAGFIGNGHFMRDALHGIHEAERLAGEMPLVEAIYAVNQVSQDFLVRPMGIFQLIDYVGIDVVRFIMNVMNPHLPEEDLHSDLLDKLFDMGVKGGQNSDGSQKDGFLKYERSKPVAVFNPETKEYVGIDQLKDKVESFLGGLPSTWNPWKTVNFSKGQKDAMLETYFSELLNLKTKGAELARKYNARSNEIGNFLVSSGVANNADDVNTVMLTGFYHAYGPINQYLK
ncbi:MAG TPA: 3-hydroxyacyl-CoA dehydrogenase family protein [Bacteroidales bacterium]|nr:3-hydroxyacyl-CoA dehydrogenase family protein [Bacteroidales bacterium]HPE57836.1 3-hydroxyacyl-CoA dehydrogenase family protein [Bacteroidales bacterium]HRX97416.1 3-hydroxyacyl-CoA dehydrogenase family protein [Bacteroidales bacterium]